LTALRLSTNCTHLALADAISTAGLLSSPVERIVLQLPADCFVHSSALALLASWGLRLRASGATFHAVGDDGARRYLSRMNLFRLLGVKYEEQFERRAEVGRFIPLTLIESDGTGVKESVDGVCDLILRQFDNAREFLPAVEWAANEMIDNIRNHASATTPGAVCAQYYRSKQLIDIGISDMGRGIKASLSTRYDRLWSHGDAVAKALQAGVTRDPNEGQGNGLAGALEIMKANGGEFRLWTGDVDFNCDDGEVKGFTLIPELPGTGVMLRFRTNHAVDLAATSIIGDPAWTYLDAQAQRAAEEGGLRIVAECHHTGGRPPARALRRKVEALLDSMEGPLTLDFDGVRTPSSSFLDELLGKLFAKLGRDQAEQRLRVVNMNDLTKRLTAHVVEQRLGSRGEVA